jgi:DNA-binding transcriptional MerR regulator
MNRAPLILWTAGDAAKALGVSPASVATYADFGSLPTYAVTPNNMRLFDPDEVQLFGKQRLERKDEKRTKQITTN